MEKIKSWVNSSRGRRALYWALAAVMVLWVVFRFAMIALQSRQVVFNATRDAVANGTPVTVVVMERRAGTLREPVSVKNNRAYVSTARMHRFAAGDRVGDGVIVSVSGDVDLSSGMHVVRTRGVADGAYFAESKKTGFWVPVYAVANDTVMVASDGVAHARKVQVARRDAENALVTDGLNDGDAVILSRVSDGEKIKIMGE